MLLREVAEASQDVGATSSRLAKTERIATLLRSADPAEVAIVVSWLAGELPQRQIGVGWAALRAIASPATTSSLDLLGVDATFSEIGALSGAGSQAKRAAALDALFGP